MLLRVQVFLTRLRVPGVPNKAQHHVGPGAGAQ